MADKRLSAAEAAGRLQDGMTIGFGGWGSRRKPLALVREIVRAGVKDLTVVSFGGPEVGLLCAAGQVRKLVFGFVSLDSIPLEPHFRRARQRGDFEVMELDEGMLQWGLYAASLRLPFLPTRAGLGSDILTSNPSIRTVQSPYDDGEELVAMPALKLDAAFLHVHRADAGGNCQILGPAPHFDELYAGAADAVYVSCERVIKTADLTAEGPIQTLRIPRIAVTGVIEARGGAGFTDCSPDYPRDEAAQKAYVVAAKGGDETWTTWLEEWLA